MREILQKYLATIPQNYQGKKESISTKNKLAWDIWELSVLSLHIFCKCKTTVNLESYLKKKTMPFKK